MVPVVKSYPQFSQNKASGAAGSEQLGQAWVAGAGAGAAVAGAGIDVAAGVAAAPIGSPQTSQ
jgi:hypothetical protein